MAFITKRLFHDMATKLLLTDTDSLVYLLETADVCADVISNFVSMIRVTILKYIQLTA